MLLICENSQQELAAIVFEKCQRRVVQPCAGLTICPELEILAAPGPAESLLVASNKETMS